MIADAISIPLSFLMKDFEGVKKPELGVFQRTWDGVTEAGRRLWNRNWSCCMAIDQVGYHNGNVWLWLDEGIDCLLIYSGARWLGNFVLELGYRSWGFFLYLLNGIWSSYNIPGSLVLAVSTTKYHSTCVLGYVQLNSWIFWVPARICRSGAALRSASIYLNRSRSLLDQAWHVHHDEQFAYTTHEEILSPLRKSTQWSCPSSKSSRSPTPIPIPRSVANE